MQRRQAIIAAIGAVIGIMSGKAKSEPVSGTAPTPQYSLTMPPQPVTFNLEIFEKFTFNWKGESVTITGKEIFDALKST